MTVTHGRAGTYNSGCRCEACTRVNTERNLRQRDDRRARLQADPTLATHGKASTYTNWGCRCLACREANSEKCAEWKARVIR